MKCSIRDSRIAVDSITMVPETDAERLFIKRLYDDGLLVGFGADMDGVMRHATVAILNSQEFFSQLRKHDESVAQSDKGNQPIHPTLREAT